MIYNYSVSLTPKKPGRAAVDRLEEAICRNLDQVYCPVKNHFAPGLYAREMFIPAGTVAVGMVHKTAHLTIVSMGRLQLLTEDGTKEFQAGDIILSQPGIKRAAYALEDTKLVTLHPTQETDLDKLCLELVEARPEELLGGKDNKQLAAQRLRQLRN